MTLIERFGVGEERIDHVADRPGHDLRYSVDTSRIRSLGWQPKVSFEEGLDRTIAFYREREDWWRPLKSGGASVRRGGAG
jgi:dTDP-glucose 4,6-dehydratase